LLALLNRLWTDRRAVRLSPDDDDDANDGDERNTPGIALLPLGESKDKEPDSDDEEGKGEYWNWHSDRAPKEGDRMKFG
jgi:hypothetical protein